MSSLQDLPLRDHLRGKKPYGPPRFDVPVRLNSNESAYQVPELVVAEIAQAVADAARGANRYPDDAMLELRGALANYLGHGLSADNMWAGNGSNEMVAQLLQAFGGPGRYVLNFEPSYSMYPILSATTGTGYIAEGRDADFELSAETAVAAVKRHNPDVVFLCNPNNPTGTPLEAGVVEAVYEAANGIVLVDEAYLEFASPKYKSAVDLLEGRERLVISRTMSKALGYAGVRLGYLAANPAVVEAMQLVRLPYHLSSLSQAAALVALAHADSMLAHTAETVALREELIQELRDRGFSPYRSESNFILFGGVEDPEATFAKIVADGVLIRSSDIPHHLRVTVGSRAEVEAFLAALG